MSEQRKKYLKKSHYKKQLRQVVVDIQNNNVDKYNFVAIQGFPGLFRIRVGDLRIVYKKTINGRNTISYIGPRGDIYNILKKI